MKRIISIIIALLMFACCAHAESGVTPLDNKLFNDAKEALVLFGDR